MRIFILSVVLLTALSSCNQKPASGNLASNIDSTFVIHGTVAGLDTGAVIFIHRDDDNKVYDTVAVKKGAFEYTGKVPVAEGMVAYTCFIDGKDDTRIDLLVENGKMELTAKLDSFDNATVSGSVSQNDFNAFNQLTRPIDAKLNALEVAFKATKEKELMDSVDKAYDALDSVRQSLVPAFVKEHNKSIASAYIITRTLLIQPKIAVVEPVYNSLDSVVKNSKYGKVIEEELNAIKRTAVGEIAPDFTLNDTAVKKTSVGQMAPDFTMNDRDGKPVALSSLRGKFIFLDFWASWCGPCRRENPNIVAAYAKFHSAKFDILGVSLDTKKGKWEDAIAKDNLTWNHVSDLKGWGNAAGKTYGIRSIPANLLLDKDGKILARNLYGADLEKKLAEVLK